MSSYGRGGGTSGPYNSQKGFCSVHKMRRMQHDLMDNGDGTFRCIPSNECEEVRLEMCVNHQVKRPSYQLEKIRDGIFQCYANNPCRSGGHHHHHHHSKDGAFQPRPQTEQSQQQQQPAPHHHHHHHRAPMNFTHAGVIRGRGDGQQSESFAASAVKFDTSNLIKPINNNNNSNNSAVQSDAAAAAFNERFAPSSANSGFFSQRDRNFNGGRGAGNQQQQNFEALRLQQQLEQQNLYQQSEVWCCHHGRKIELRSAKSTDGGMTFRCIEPNACLAAKLDDPKTVLVPKGCLELFCMTHKRLRGATFMVAGKDKKGDECFVCKKHHECRPIVGGNAGGSGSNVNDDM